MQIFLIALAIAAGLMTSPGKVSAGSAGGSQPGGAQVQELQERMLSDKGIMALILSLQGDPEVQSLLADPDVVKAVNSGDVNALAENPRFLRLLDKPQVRQVLEQVDRQHP